MVHQDGNIVALVLIFAHEPDTNTSKASEASFGESDPQRFKGAMWALRKSEEQLTDDDQDVLICLFEHSPCLKMAYEFCHELTSIFDTQLSKREGKRQMRKWMHTVRASELRCFDSFLTI